jgi:hypothetical protein
VKRTPHPCVICKRRRVLNQDGECSMCEAMIDYVQGYALAVQFLALAKAGVFTRLSDELRATIKALTDPPSEPRD